MGADILYRQSFILIETFAMLEEMVERLVAMKNILPNQVKDLYYKLFGVVRDTYRTLQIQTSFVPSRFFSLSVNLLTPQT